MKEKVALHVRSRPMEFHRHLGAVTIELDREPLFPDQDIRYEAEGRRVKAHVSCVRAGGGHMPHVYVDEIAEAETA